MIIIIDKKKLMIAFDQMSNNIRCFLERLELFFANQENSKIKTSPINDFT